MADRITYVGLDVHKESIVVAVASGGLRGEVREYGRIANTAAALDRLMRKLGGAGGFAQAAASSHGASHKSRRRLFMASSLLLSALPAALPSLEFGSVADPART